MKNATQFRKSAMAFAVASLLSGTVIGGGPTGSISQKAVNQPQLLDKGVVATAQPRDDGAGNNAAQRSEMAPNRVIVKFKDVSWTQGYQYGKGIANPAVLAQSVRLAAAEQGVLGKIGAKVIKAFPGLGVMVLEISGEGRQAVGRAIEALYRSGRVEYAQPDFVVRVQATPNDPDFGSLWGLHNTGQSGGTTDADIDAPEAWDKRTGAGAAVTIGVIDTGIDYTHPDIQANMWKNPGETAGNGIDDDGNGYVDDVYGIDTYNYDTDPLDDNGHGTHVAGTIGARGNNGKQVVGVNWTAKLMALKFLSGGGSGYTSDAVTLINYVIDLKSRHGIQRIVLNNSWGGGGYAQSLYDAIDAAKNVGILFIAAAGNDGMNTDGSPHYPSSYDLPNIVSIGASDRYEAMSYFSNYGCSSTDLFAPGSDILSTIPGGGTASYNGTSMATPHVTGAAALIWAKNPSWTWRKVKAALMNGVDAKAAYKGKSVTGGRLNVNTSIAAAMGSKPSIWSVTPPVGGPGDDIVINGINFGSTAGTVTIGSNTLVIKSWNSTSITATLPSDVPYGQLSVKVTDSQNVASRMGGCFLVSIVAAPIDQTLIPRAWHAGAKVGSNYWLIGGETHWGATGIVEKYTPATKKKLIDSDWMMPAVVTNAAAAAIGSKIYVIGGIDWSSMGGEVKKIVQVFDTSTGTWSSASDLPDARAQGAAVAMGDGNIYFFGGFDASWASSNKVYRYDPASNAWTEMAAMPEARIYPAAVRAGAANTAWVMGGRGPSGDRKVYVYNQATNAWATKPNTPSDHYGAAGAWYKSQPNVLFGFYGSNLGEFWDSATAKWVSAYSGPQLYTSRGDVFTDLLLFNGFNYGSYGYSNTIYRVKR